MIRFWFCIVITLQSLTSWCTTLGQDTVLFEVSPYGNYKTLGEAIKNAKSGTVILIKKGQYSENSIIIDKSLSIIGETGAEIHHRGEGDAILISASNVLIKGLKIIGSGKSSYQDFAAVKAVGVSRCHIVENEILESQYGIVVNNSTDCVVAKNVIKTNSSPSDLLGDGIHLWKTTHVSVSENIVYGHRDGIYLEFAQSGLITKNNINRNRRYGLHFMFSNGNEFRENTFSQNDAGVAVMYSKNIKMVDNLFSQNKGAASFGLLLKDISDSVIDSNRFEDNTVGIFMEGSNRNDVIANRFDGNGWALRLLSSCDENNFSLNLFLNNTLEVATNGNENSNTFEKNYWLRHDNVDLDFDGYADIPYQPTSFSSYILEKYSNSILLIGSPILVFLDWLERLFPSLSPIKLQDQHPIMKEK